MPGSGRLPRVIEGRLVADECDLGHLERELHRLGHVFDRDHQRTKLPPLAVVAPDEHVAAVVLGYTAAAPVWSVALSAIAELDAAVFVTGCTDFATWDAAVAAPIAGWSVGVAVDGDEPSLRELARSAIDGQRRALRAAIAGDGGAGAPSTLAALAGAWENAAGLVALGALRTAISERRQALVEIGAHLDTTAGDGTPRHAAALTLAGRALVAHALASAVGEWLDNLDVASDHPTRVAARVEAERVCGVARAVGRNVAITAAAITTLVGMDI